MKKPLTLFLLGAAVMLTLALTLPQYVVQTDSTGVVDAPTNFWANEAIFDAAFSNAVVTVAPTGGGSGGGATNPANQFTGTFNGNVTAAALSLVVTNGYNTNSGAAGLYEADAHTLVLNTNGLGGGGGTTYGNDNGQPGVVNGSNIGTNLTTLATQSNLTSASNTVVGIAANASNLTSGTLPDAVVSPNTMTNWYGTNTGLAVAYVGNHTWAINTNSWGSGGSQSPWTSDINAAGKSLTNANNVTVTNLLTVGTSGASQTNLVVNGANPFALGNGEWWTTPIPFLRPTTSGKGIAFDIMPNGASAQQSTWIDICSSDFLTNSSSPTGGEKLHLQKDANGNGHITMSAISATYRDLDIQDESATGNLYFGHSQDIGFLQSFAGSGDLPSGSVINTASQDLSVIAAGSTKGIMLGYVDSAGNKSAVEITNNATGANDGTLKLMKGGGFITSGAGTNTFSGAVILSSPSSATSAYTLGLTAGGVVTETGSGLSTLLSTNTTPTLFLGRDSNSNLTVTAAGATFTGVDIPTNTSGTHGYTGYFTNGIFVSSGTY